MKISHCWTNPKFFQFRLGILFDVGENHFPRVAVEKTIRKIDNPFPIDFRSNGWVICFGKKMWRGLCAATDRWSGKVTNNFFLPIRLAA